MAVSEGLPLSEGEAECCGELAYVDITGRLRRVFPRQGNWWARLELDGPAAEIAAEIDVPLIAVRLADKLRAKVRAPR